MEMSSIFLLSGFCKNENSFAGIQETIINKGVINIAYPYQNYLR